METNWQSDGPVVPVLSDFVLVHNIQLYQDPHQLHGNGSGYHGIVSFSMAKCQTVSVCINIHKNMENDVFMPPAWKGLRNFAIF